MNNPEEPNRNNLPPPVTVIVTLIVITIIVFPTVILAQWWLYYSSTVLLWDAAQTAMISYSGLAVILAFFIVLAMRRLSRSTKPEDIQRISGLVTEWTGWVILLLAFSFSESQSILHVSRHLYFPLAVVGLLLLGVSNFRRYQRGSDKTSLISVVVVIICLATECFRYITGLEKLTF